MSVSFTGWYRQFKCWQRTEKCKQVNFLWFKGPYSWAEAFGEYQPITIHLTHHQQSSGTLHHPRLWKRTRLPPQVWITAIPSPFICHLTCRLRFTLKPIGLSHWNQTILLYFLIFCLSVDIRSYWTATRPPTTSSVAPCVGWLFGWTSSASFLSLSSHCSLSSCTIKYLPPMQAWPYHTLCRYVYEVQKKTFLISELP